MSSSRSFAIVLLGLSLGCGARTVVPDGTDRCPLSPPSYRAEVAPIVREKCFSCHAGTGEAAEDHDFSTLEKVHTARRGIEGKVFARAMPPQGAPALTEQQRDVLLAWLACQAPNN
jgi:mono/diheme cytochrome c family protein